MRARPLAERFWEKVDRSNPDGCWAWKAARKRNGYGEIGSDGGRGQPLAAHRISYQLNVGPIPDTFCVCHRCDNPSCVNPAHLFLGTRQDNMRDALRKARLPRATAWQTVRALRRDYIREPQPVCILADRYGVSESTAGHILAAITMEEDTDDCQAARRVYMHQYQGHPTLLNLCEAAAYLGVSRQCVQRLVKRALLPSQPWLKTYRIHIRDLERRLTEPKPTGGRQKCRTGLLVQAGPTAQ